MKPITIIASISLTILVCSCSTASVTVMPGENNLNRVVVRDIKKESAEEEAVKAANKYCERRGKSALFVSNKANYEGSMNENTRNTIRNVSTGAMILGPTVGVLTGHHTAGGLVGLGGLGGRMMTSNKDYTAETIFKCE